MFKQRCYWDNLCSRLTRQLLLPYAFSGRSPCYLGDNPRLLRQINSEGFYEGSNF